MKEILMRIVTVFMIICLFNFQIVFADTILFKNGRYLDVEKTWEENGQIKYKMYGATVGFPKEEIEKVVVDNPPDEKRSKSLPKKSTYSTDLNNQKRSYNNTYKQSTVSNQLGKESKSREIASREYPNDSKMQNFVYKKQVIAARYMETVYDRDVKNIALQQYPNDYSMQKFVYDKQSSAKRYMASVNDSDVNNIALRGYPKDYSMQKYVYDKQLSAKHYMASMPNDTAKNKAIREYPNDYSMQKYIYDRLRR